MQPYQVRLIKDVAFIIIGALIALSVQDSFATSERDRIRELDNSASERYERIKQERNREWREQRREREQVYESCMQSCREECRE
jgi:Mg2+/citrate symporter